MGDAVRLFENSNVALGLMSVDKRWDAGWTYVRVPTYDTMMTTFNVPDHRSGEALKASK